jgi:hypothetical protein
MVPRALPITLQIRGYHQHFYEKNAKMIDNGSRHLTDTRAKFLDNLFSILSACITILVPVQALLK